MSRQWTWETGSSSWLLILEPSVSTDFHISLLVASVQILSPVIGMFLPIAALCFAVFTNLMSITFAVYNVDGYIGVTMLSLFPMVNAVLKIFFVAPYRQYTIRWLTFVKAILHKVEHVVDVGSGLHIVSDIAAAYQRRQTMVFVFVQRFKPMNSTLPSS